MQFRKRPVQIEAYPFINDDQAVFIRSWVGRENCDLVLNEDETVSSLAIHTLEGTMTVSRGDWVIKGVQGEFYPCKPEIFNETYQTLEEVAAEEAEKAEKITAVLDTAAEPKEWIERQEEERRAWAVSSAIAAGALPEQIVTTAIELETFVKTKKDADLHDQEALDSFYIVVADKLGPILAESGVSDLGLTEILEETQDLLTADGVRFKNGKHAE